MALTLTITDVGRAALVAQGGTNAVQIASCGVSATAVDPRRTMTALPGETKRIATISGQAVAPDIIHMIVRDESTDVFTVRSLALYLTDGTLFAIYGQSAPVLEKAASSVMLLAVDVTFADIAASQITFGSTNFLNPPATIETPGVVELATDAEATALTDALRALSPKNMAAIFTAANILSRLLQADGAGSGLDADLLDGRQAAEFALLAGATFVGALNAPSIAVTGANGARVAAASPLFSFYNAAQTDRFGYLQHTGANGDLSIVNDQGGSVKITTGGSTTLLVGPSGANVVTSMAVQGATPNFEFYSVNRATRFGYLTHSGAGGTLSVINDQGGTIALNTGGKNVLTIGPAGATVAGVFAVSGVISSNGSAVWHAANDGAGSGLDADLLDGRQAAEFALLTGADFTGPVSTTRVTATGPEGFRAAAASPLLSFFNAAQSTRFGYLQHAGTNGALSIVNEQGAPINLNTGGKNVVVVGPSGAYIDGVLAQSGAGKYLHHADGNIAGDTVTRGTAAPAGGRDGDMHFEANVAAGTVRVWHNYAGTWVHT